MNEEKRRMDARIAQLEEDLEEEQNNYQHLEEKQSKIAQERDKLVAELSNERGRIQALEGALTQSERQLKDLRQKLDDAEAQGRGKLKSQIASLEQQILSLESQMEGDSREKQNMGKLNRKLEKRIKEIQLQV